MILEKLSIKNRHMDPALNITAISIYLFPDHHLTYNTINQN